MPRRKLPSPEEYGRRLAEAKRRAEKRTHENVRQTADSFSRVLGQLDEQKQALADVAGQIAALPTEALSPADMEASISRLIDHLAAIQLAVENIHVDAPEPQLPTLMQGALEELLAEVRADRDRPQVMVPPVQQPVVAPQESILGGPITLHVDGRDSNGDIDTVRVEPTKH